MDDIEAIERMVCVIFSSGGINVLGNRTLLQLPGYEMPRPPVLCGIPIKNQPVRGQEVVRDAHFLFPRRPWWNYQEAVDLLSNEVQVREWTIALRNAIRDAIESNFDNKVALHYHFTCGDGLRSEYAANSLVEFFKREYPNKPMKAIHFTQGIAQKVYDSLNAEKDNNMPIILFSSAAKYLIFYHPGEILGKKEITRSSDLWGIPIINYPIQAEEMIRYKHTKHPLESWGDLRVIEAIIDEPKVKEWLLEKEQEIHQVIESYSGQKKTILHFSCTCEDNYKSYFAAELLGKAIKTKYPSVEIQHLTLEAIRMIEESKKRRSKKR